MHTAGTLSIDIIKLWLCSSSALLSNQFNFTPLQAHLRDVIKLCTTIIHVVHNTYLTYREAPGY